MELTGQVGKGLMFLLVFASVTGAIFQEHVKLFHRDFLGGDGEAASDPFSMLGLTFSHLRTQPDLKR